LKTDDTVKALVFC